MKRKWKRPAWTPFQRGDVVELNKRLADLGVEGEDEVWLNSIYQVNVKRMEKPKGWPCDIIHLSIKTLTKRAEHDWRDFQRIKNELVGPEHEAVELYPAECRLVDTSNQYHLWVMAEPEVFYPFGFTQRAVWEGNVLNTKQRPFRKDERPSDCRHMTLADIEEMKRKEAEPQED